MPFDAGATSPLQGIRVLDFTHVLAGPRSARTLAEYGADVLHITSPAFPDTLAQHLGVDEGKKCAYLRSPWSSPIGIRCNALPDRLMSSQTVIAPE